MCGKTRSRNKLPAVQEAERQRWKDRWEAAHPGEEYERRQFRQMDEYGRECSYSGEGNCGHSFKPWSEFRTNGNRRRETRCKACQASRTLFNRYAITYAERLYLDEVAVFGPGLCDLHGGPESMAYQRWSSVEAEDLEKRGLSIDHAHGCDQGHAPEKGCRYCIRGLVCCECNRNIIRMAEKHSELAKRFADYLARRPLLAVLQGGVPWPALISLEGTVPAPEMREGQRNAGGPCTRRRATYCPSRFSVHGC